jgi:hypothetical protein
MEFPRLIFLARLIHVVFPVPSKSRDTVGIQRRPFQKCVSGNAHSNGMETRNTLILCLLGPRKLLLRSLLSTPERIPSSF